MSPDTMNARRNQGISLPQVLALVALIAGATWVVMQATVRARTCQPGPPPPLLKAVLRNDVAVAKRLLVSGEDPLRGCAPFGVPCPWDAALKKGNPEMIQLLRDYGAFSPRSLRITNQLRAVEGLPPLVITSRTGRAYQ